MKFTWLTPLRDIFFPACCVHCKKLCDTQINLCNACLEQLPKINKACPVCSIPNEDGLLCPSCYYHPPSYTKIICPYLYKDPLPQFIQGLKFSSQLIYANLLAELILQKVENENPACLIPMPLHPKRTRERGFNQSLEIAKRISKRMNIPIVHNVIRHKQTQTQSKIARHDRKHNMINAFVVKGDLPKSVAIIDDVVTTGATVESLAQCLKKQGMTSIQVWCAARTILQ